MTRREASRRALLIGIDAYEFEFPQLRGCVNDATLIRQILRDQFAFQEENMRLVTDRQATQQTIREELKKLAQCVQQDDTVVLYYAGHGSRMRDREGTKLSGWDETLVPCDSGRDENPNRDISDDEIRIWLLGVGEKTPYVTLIFDCCHSATQHRGTFAVPTRGVPDDRRSISELPPSPIIGQIPQLHIHESEPRRRHWLPGSDRYIVLAACRDNERAKEIAVPGSLPQTWHGAFTYHLVRQLNQANSHTTYRDVFEATCLSFQLESLSQNPSCEGEMQRQLFGTGSLVRPRSVAISEVLDGRVTLIGGLAQGVVVGSKWQVLESNEASLSTQAELPRFQIDQVSAFSAVGHILGNTQIIAPTRAVLIEQPMAKTWAIDIVDLRIARKSSDTVVTEMRERVNNSPWLHAVAPNEGHHARVCRLSPCEGALLGLPESELAKIGSELWAVIGQDGTLLMRLLPLGETATVVENLEKRVRQALVRDLVNPQSQLSGMVEFHIYLLDSRNLWSRAHAHPEEVAIVHRGTRIALQLTNRHTRPLYVTVLVLDADGSISQIYPPKYGQQILIPEKVRWLGYEEGDGHEIVVDFPRQGSFAARADGGSFDSAIDSYKLLISTMPLDTVPLFQSGVRSGARLAKDSRHALEQILTTILTTGIGQRSAFVSSRKDEDFATELRTLRIVR